MSLLSWFRRTRHRPAVPPGQRVYAIGDIHGCLDRFEALLATIEADDRSRAPATTTVILLGDLIDRGPDSAGVVRRAMTPLHWAELRALKGNHEGAMIDGLLGNEPALRMWLVHGGVASLESWEIDLLALCDLAADAVPDYLLRHLPEDQLLWMAGLPLSLKIGDYFFVHAGVRPGIALDEQSDTDRLWIRDDFLNSRQNFGAMIVHGHTVFETVQLRPNRISIDTGAYLGGALTAIGLESDERWFLAA